MRPVILFNSQCLTIKSIYRKRLKNGKFKIYFRFKEMTETVCFEESNKDWTEELKKGDVVTLHLGNGGYGCIEKGNKVPENGVMSYMPRKEA